MRKLTLEVTDSCMEEISRQSSIETTAGLLLPVFSQVYSEVRDHTVEQRSSKLATWSEEARVKLRLRRCGV